MTQADRSRRCYMSRKVPATNLRVFFSVISGITVIAIAAAPVIHGNHNRCLHKQIGNARDGKRENENIGNSY